MSSPWRLQAIFLAIAAVGVFPFVVWGTFLGHDFAFFASSWIEVARQLQHGNLWPRLAAGANFGAGEPRFIFYPPLSWMAGGALHVLLPTRLVPGLFAFLTLWLAANSAFRFAREWFSHEQAATAALVYALNPYLLYCLYARSAFAELLASSLLPLALLWLVRLFDEGGFVAARNFAFAFALIWLADVPAAIVISYALLAIAGAEAWRGKAVRPLARCAGASLLAAGLSAFYVVPVIWERNWIASATAISRAAEFSGSHLLHIAGGALLVGAPMAKLLLVAIVEVAACAAMLAFWWRRLGRLSLPLAVLLVVSALAVLSPWHFIWSHLPLMLYAQFSWRWLLVLAVPLSLSGAMLLDKLSPWPYAKFVYVGVIAALSLMQTAHYSRNGAQFAQRLQADIDAGRGYGGIAAYAPADHTQENTQRELVRIGSRGVSVEQWSEEYKKVRIAAGESTNAIFRVGYFPAWRAKVNGVEGPLVKDDATGLTQVDVPAAESEVELRFSRTADRTIGVVISLFVFAGVIIWPRLTRS